MSNKRIRELEYHVEQLLEAIDLARVNGRITHDINPESLNAVRARWMIINDIYKSTAKNAFAYHGASKHYRNDDEVKEACREYKVSPVELEHPYRMRSLRLPYFDEQYVWEIVELSAKVEDCGKRLKQAERLLREIWSYGYHDVDKIKVEKFLFGE